MKGRNLPLALLLEFVYNFLFNMNGFKTRVGQENKDISNKPSRSNPAHRCPNRGHSSLCPEGNNVHQPFSELIPSSLLSLALFVPNVVRPAFIPLVLVPVICGHKKASAGTTGTAVVDCVCRSFSSETIDCFREMNEERKATGLPEFRQASEETQVLLEHPDSGRKITAATLWSEICKKLAGNPQAAAHQGEMPGLSCFSFYYVKEAGDTTQAKQLEGTFAYYSGKKDCKAAVQHWKDGFSLFKNELPPTYTALNDPQIYTDQAVSFVALYNPKASPVASCSFVTCTGGAVFAAPDLSKSHERRAVRRLEELEADATAVICLTNPKALTTGAAPFKEDEWQKIVHAIVGTEGSNGVSPVFSLCAASTH